MSATQDKRIEDVLLACGELMGCAADVDQLVMVLAGTLTAMGFVVVPVELLRDVLPEFIQAAKKRGITMPTLGEDDRDTLPHLQHWPITDDPKHFSNELVTR